MKTILKACVLATIGLTIYSCNTNDDGSGYYKPAEYVFENDFTLKIDEQSIADYSTNAIYTASAQGTAHAVLVEADQPAPSFATIYYKGYKNAKIDTIATYKFDVIKDKAYTIEAKNLNADQEYKIYAIHETIDGFVAEKAPLSVSFETVDTIDPTFLKDNSEPTNTAEDVDPFAEITLQFSEPIFYKGGTITFTGDKGRIVKVDNADDLMINDKTVIIKNHGTFPQDDIVSVTWEKGVFADKSGRTVAALSGKDYSFKTRKFSDKETVSLMQGEYDYNVKFYGSLEQYHAQLSTTDFPSTTGKFELVLDKNDPTGMTLLGINIFNGHPSPEPETFKIKIGSDGKIVVSDTKESSFIKIPDLVTPKPTEWGNQIVNTVEEAGTYNFATGEIVLKKALYYAGTSNIYDVLDYEYKRIGTYK